MVQNEQRHDREERSDDLSGQPCGQGLLSDLLDTVTGKKKQQLISDQQDGEGTASTRMRSSSLAAISADSARSNAESIAEVFTGAELN
jgi:hypothetical protein